MLHALQKQVLSGSRAASALRTHLTLPAGVADSRGIQWVLPPFCA